MNKKIILTILMGMFLISLASAETSLTSLGTFEINKEIELTQTCSNETSLCDGCNITSVKYPDSSDILSYVQMTQRESDFNYTLNDSVINTYGEYTIKGYCWTASEVKVFSFRLDVTKTGNKEMTGSESVPLILISLTMIIITILFFTGYLKHDSIGSKVFFGSFTVIFLFVTILFNGVIMEDLISRYSNLTGGYNTFLLVIKIMLSFGVLLFSLYAGMVALKLWRFKRGFGDD